MKVLFEDWKKLDLRIGKIGGVKDHPSADKLYILLVDLGKGEHDVQIVAGLKENYNKALCIDAELMFKFIQDTQEKTWQKAASSVCRATNYRMMFLL